MPMPRAGEIVLQRYEVLSLIGEGGSGRVYHAREVGGGRDVALKFVTPQNGEFTEKEIARLHREAQVLGNLRDPHTIKLYDFGQTSDGMFYMVSELVRGSDLESYVSAGTSLGEPRVRRILRQIMASLREAHSLGVIHRDLKPANILLYEALGQADQVKVIDFGIAKPFTHDAIVQGTLTAEGNLVGTVLYMAPEQLRGQRLSPATDMFAAGLITMELLTGRRAIEENARFDVWTGFFTRGESLTLPRETPVSDELRHLVNRMLRVDPLERPQSADDVLAALDAMRAGVTAPESPWREEVIPTLPHAPPTSPIHDERQRESAAPEAAPTLQSVRPAEWEQMRRVLVLAAVLTCLVVLALFWLLTGEEERPATVEWRAEPAVVAASGDAGVMVAASARDSGVSPAMDGVQRDAGEDEIGGRIDAAVVGAIDVAPPNLSPKRVCDGSPVVEGRRRMGARVAGVMRYWWAYVPPDVPPGPRPVVFLIHEYGRSAEAMLRYTRFEQRAEREGFVVVAPGGVQPTPWWDANDPAFLQRVLEDTSQVACVDSTRVYAIGHGRGGTFLEDVVCAGLMPFRAFATTGQRGGVECRARRAVPTMHLEGVRNATEPVEGGGVRNVVPLKRKEEYLLELHQCGAERHLYANEREGSCHTWSCARAPLVLCRIDGGRDWPGTPPRNQPFGDYGGEPADFPYADTIWRFLTDHGADGSERVPDSE